MSTGYSDFYNEKYASGEYMPGDTMEAEKKSGYIFIEQFIEKYKIRERNGKCLEIGSGRGIFQDMVNDYTGLDYSQVVKKYYHKPFVSGSAMDLPFEDNSFDYMWSRAVWEHIPDPELALKESMRVLKIGGVFLLHPAWHCRPWAANGYQVRPYSDFDICGKIYKFLIPALDFLPYRMFKMFIKRLFWLIVYIIMPKDRFRLPYKKLNANYDVFWQSDSDACCDLDPFLTILWVKAKGYKVPSHKRFIRQFLIRNEAIEIEK